MLKGLVIIKFNIITFGCKVNLYESENLKELFQSEGFEYTSDEIDAEIIIVNSCTVTSISDKKVRREIHRIRKINPNVIMVLTGCFPQAFPLKSELLGADILTGTKNKREIIELVKKYVINREKINSINVYTKDDQFEEMTNTEFEEKTRAFVKIQDGCNQFCSYCIIPYARGRLRSKPLDMLEHEAKILAHAGHSEIVLVGINLAFYGFGTDIRLVDAVETCCSVDGIKRVRLGSLEPEMISDEDISRLSEQPKFCPQFHLSLQSGCDKTLKAMNRKYTADEYYNLAKKLKDSFKDCALTTDIMVGFPGESDEDYKETCRFAVKIGFAKVHVFPYSRREGTVAYSMEMQVNDSIKTQRAKEMNNVANTLQAKYLKNQEGKIFEVLFEKENCTEFHQGYTPNYTLVKIPSKNDDNSLRRMIFYVKIIKAYDDFCLGEIIEN